MSRIDIELIVPHEAQESDVGLLRQLYRQTGRRANGRDKRDARHQGFLYQFEAGPAADQQQVLVKRKRRGKKLFTDQLVQRVVAAYVFPNI